MAVLIDACGALAAHNVGSGTPRVISDGESSRHSAGTLVPTSLGENRSALSGPQTGSDIRQGRRRRWAGFAKPRQRY